MKAAQAKTFFPKNRIRTVKKPAEGPPFSSYALRPPFSMQPIGGPLVMDFRPGTSDQAPGLDSAAQDKGDLQISVSTFPGMDSPPQKKARAEDLPQATPLGQGIPTADAQPMRMRHRVNERVYQSDDDSDVSDMEEDRKPTEAEQREKGTGL